MELTSTTVSNNRLHLFNRYGLYGCLFVGLVLYLIIFTCNDKDNSFTNFYSQLKNEILNFNSTTREFLNNLIISDSTKPPLVLIWTTSFGEPWDWAEAQLFHSCPTAGKCVGVTLDRTRVNESSAVVFHIWDHNWTDIPQWRYPHQYYVFANLEAPPHTYRYLQNIGYPYQYCAPGHRDFFNLTMTYRLDSDQPWTYGKFRKLNSEELKNRSWNEVAENLQFQIVQGKSKLVAWFASNCDTDSKREKFVNELKKYIQVDVYGGCGDLTCPRLHKRCNQLLSRDYKFYLSLENSICKDYVSEKLFQHMDQSIVVPVVMDRKLLLNTIRDEESARIINRSFIAVDDFGTVQQLAEYLKYLDENDTAYMEYFHWKRTHVVDSTQEFCEFCNILKEKKIRKMENINKWYMGEANCHQWNKSKGYEEREIDMSQCFL